VRIPPANKSLPHLPSRIFTMHKPYFPSLRTHFPSIHVSATLALYAGRKKANFMRRVYRAVCRVTAGWVLDGCWMGGGWVVDGWWCVAVVEGRGGGGGGDGSRGRKGVERQDGKAARRFRFEK
jgi:hypothetical protein